MKRGVAVRQDDFHIREAGEGPRLALVHSAWPDDAAPLPLAHRIADRMVGACSLVGTAPLLDVRGFGWTCDLRDQWRAIREEAERSAGTLDAVATPLTAAALAGIDGLCDARFERLEPGVHASARALCDRALLTCHLGLVVPRDGDLRMRLGEHVVRWAEGETLLFDATRARGWRNDGRAAGLVLTLRLRRQLRQPAQWLVERMRLT